MTANNQRAATPNLKGLNDDEALRTILEGTAIETGKGFFSALVQNLARALDTYGAWVTEYLEGPRRLRALAFWLGGQWVENYECTIDGTPCEVVITGARLVHYPDRVIELYPNEPSIQSIGVASYLGVPLLGLDGKVLGHLAVLDRRPMPESPRNMALFHIFAARAAAELQRMRAEAQVREREEKLGRLVDSAMDAIMELDHNLMVTRVNRATQKVFNCSDQRIMGQRFVQFLSEDGAEKLERLIRELDARPEGQQYLWIPGGLRAVCPDGHGFSAEATLSRFEMQSETYYTLILRNINDRLEAEQRIHALTAETEYLKEEIKAEHNFEEILGRSPALSRVLDEVQQVAGTDATVLITGETGTGKELIARAIHAASGRSSKPFVKVNCAALPASLIESELFGHEKGAFTGATLKREGRFALADTGTIFLDEIGELPVDLQAKLLRILQEGEFETVGSSLTRKVDVRVLAATNCDLLQAVREGRFREDLFYRLHVFPLHLPPLRERREDIPMLAAAFTQKFAQKVGKKLQPLSSESLYKLKSYPWPGNVRELENVIERAVITAHDGHLNLTRALPDFAPEGLSGKSSAPVAKAADDPIRIRTAQEMEELEKSNLKFALDAAGWRVSGVGGAAERLGMNPSTLNSRMRALGLQRPRS